MSAHGEPPPRAEGGAASNGPLCGSTTPPVEDADRLLRIFGKWPCFHDAEVLRLTLDRAGPEGPTLEAQIHVSEMTTAIDGDGRYVLRHPTRVTLRFTNVLLETAHGFNQQNVLTDLEITSGPPAAKEGRRFGVVMGGCWGLHAELSCDRIVVVEAIPWDVAPNA
jgi:hypothetical protein